MGIEQDIYELQRLAVILGTPKTAVELGKELVTQLKQAKSTLGPRDQTGTLAKGIFAMSQPEGSIGHWSVGVGDKSILGDPSEKAPRGTIAEFLGLMRQGYRAQRARTQQRKLVAIEARARAKAGIKQTHIERKAAIAEQKRLQRVESKIRTVTRGSRASIAKAEARIRRLEQAQKSLLTRATNARTSSNLASQRAKLNRAVSEFLRKYNVNLVVREYAGQNTKLISFLHGYSEAAGFGPDFGRMEKRYALHAVLINRLALLSTFLGRSEYFTKSKDIRAKTANALRVRVRKFLAKQRKYNSTADQIDNITERLNLAREKIKTRLSEIEKLEQQIRRR